MPRQRCTCQRRGSTKRSSDSPPPPPPVITHTSAAATRALPPPPDAHTLHSPASPSGALDDAAASDRREDRAVVRTAPALEDGAGAGAGGDARAVPPAADPDAAAVALRWSMSRRMTACDRGRGAREGGGGGVGESGAGGGAHAPPPGPPPPPPPAQRTDDVCRTDALSRGTSSGRSTVEMRSRSASMPSLMRLARLCSVCTRVGRQATASLHPTRAIARRQRVASPARGPPASRHHCRLLAPRLAPFRDALPT
jgi:hypothetical protein